MLQRGNTLPNMLSARLERAAEAIIAGHYTRGGDFPKALVILDLGQHLAEQTGDNAALCNAYRMIGYVYNLKGDHQQALDYDQKSLDLAEKIGNQKSVFIAAALSSDIGAGKD